MRNLMMRTLLALFVAPLFSAVVLAAPRVGNGGDDVGLEFQSCFTTAVANLKTKSPDLYSLVVTYNFDQVLKTTLFIVVDDTLNVKLKGLVQNSVAINIPEKNEILINRQRWQQITNGHLKEGVALHEVLSLRGLEHTGNYPISAKYVSMEGLSSDELGAPTNKTTSREPAPLPFSSVENIFNTAQDTISMDDFPESDDLLRGKGQVYCYQVNHSPSDGIELSFKVYFAKIDAEVIDPMYKNDPESRRFYRLVAVAKPQEFMHPLLQDLTNTSSPSWKNSELAISPYELAQTVLEYRDVSALSYIFRKSKGALTYRMATVNSFGAENVWYGYCLPYQDWTYTAP